MNVITLPVGDMAVNCYIIYTGANAAVIDPGDDFEVILKVLKENNLTPAWVLLTHGHFDHIGAVKNLQDLGAKVYVSAEDEKMLGDNYASMGAYFGIYTEACRADVLVSDGQELVLDKMKLKVIATPGHTAGSVCYLVNDILFSGDTLFCQSVGRSDFPGGDGQTLINNIKQKLFVLNDDVRVLAGHGEATTIFNEKRFNPFVR